MINWTNQLVIRVKLCSGDKKESFGMISDLTAEERVTKILSSYQVLKKQKDSPIVNDTENLGEYLETAPKIDILEEMNIKRV